MKFIIRWDKFHKIIAENMYELEKYITQLVNFGYKIKEILPYFEEEDLK